MNHKILKVHTPSGEIKYELRAWARGRYAPQLKRRFKTRKEALDFVDEMANEETKQQLARNGEGSFGTEFEFWLKNAVPSFSPGWRKNITTYWKQLEPRLGALELQHLTKELLAEIATEFKAKGNSQKTVNSKIGFIQAVMNYSEDMRRIQVNPVARFSKTRPPEPEIEFWEQEDAEDFLHFASRKYARHDRWKYVVYLASTNAALRAGETWALKPRAIKYSQSQVYVSERLEVTDKCFYPPKGKGPRNVPLNAGLARELEILCRGLGRNDLIFNFERKPIDHDNFAGRVFKRDLEEWKGPIIKFHSLRHTAATLMLSQGVDVKTVQDILGHKDIKTTMRYVHALGKNVQRAAEIFSIAPTAKTELRLA